MPTMKTLTCENCGNEFEVLAKRKTARFCTKGCSISFRQKIHDPDFMSINDELHFYLLGLILTDGCISKQENKEERMTLRLSDKQIVEELHPLMSPDRKLYANKPYKEEHNVSYAIVSTNKEAIATLKGYGIEHGKTYSVEYPKIAKEHTHHFIRGLFDGDGSIFTNVVKQKKADGSILHRPYKHISFTTASINFAEGLKSELESFGYHPKITEDVRGGKFYVKLYRQKEIQSFGEWIYADSHYYLNRKKQSFVMI
ncbi:LAGLIDADG family homing endonuclease [Bacillus thuringiensis]|uniref:DOD-type homing endonuclease domain-containing protein n=4 Tax=Bacillus thuringiensis TaxID=1428 RepID=A0AB35PC63_BACTU|nr:MULTISPECIES: LAGLIDADG family homing endonuclease [Bacillus]EAO56652.1 Intein-containing protein [Bacillus thuringiensis serovar israelensis ATCC 35646]MEC3433758.1 LAGLIDADG family homing endonuclease [Bacillus cereus]AFQ30318.1 hypothetical protein BTF1_31087 [Bacillus thuringiensis HD-789]AJH02410.1 LAGLIDADG-like domain protein [Bacillus thuringiensis HD1002]AND28508.1 hypothetical protein ATN07_32800 [Bacillus thuringiensis serovar israelensis]